MTITNESERGSEPCPLSVLLVAVPSVLPDMTNKMISLKTEEKMLLEANEWRIAIASYEDNEWRYSTAT